MMCILFVYSLYICGCEMRFRSCSGGGIILEINQL